MPKMVKVAISLPEDLLEAAEEEREIRKESRSEFFREALQAFLRREREREAIEQYIRGYQEQPESDDEMEWIEEINREVLAEEPWE